MILVGLVLIHGCPSNSSQVIGIAAEFLSRGTRASCRVSTSSTCRPCAFSTSCGAIQYTPVLSIYPLDLPCFQPLRHANQFRGGCPKAGYFPTASVQRWSAHPVPLAPQIDSGTLRRMTSSCLLLLSELSLSSLPGIMPAEVHRLFTAHSNASWHFANVRPQVKPTSLTESNRLNRKTCPGNAHALRFMDSSITASLAIAHVGRQRTIRIAQFSPSMQPVP